MQTDDAVVAVFGNHVDADAAIKQLASDGFATKHLSLVGKGYYRHPEGQRHDIRNRHQGG